MSTSINISLAIKEVTATIEATCLEGKVFTQVDFSRVGVQAALQPHSKHTARATNGEADQNQSRSYVSPSWGWNLLPWSQVNLNNKNQSPPDGRELRKSAYSDTYKWAAQSALS